MKKMIAAVLLLAFSLAGNIQAETSHVFYGCLGPTGQASFLGDYSTMDAGLKLTFRSPGYHKFEVGMNFLYGGLYWKNTFHDNPEWKFQLGGFATYCPWPQSRFNSGIYTGIGKYLGDTYNPGIMDLGLSLDLISFRDTRVSFLRKLTVTTGLQYRGSFNYDFPGGGIGHQRSSRGLFLRFGIL